MQFPRVLSYGHRKWFLMASFLCLLFTSSNYKNYKKYNNDDIDNDDIGAFIRLQEGEKSAGFNRKNHINSNRLKVLSNGYIDYERNSRPLWPSDQECKRFNVYFGKNLPMAYLVSYPRSGNTWIRYLIEAATGVFTGSVYNSKPLIKMGFLGETEKPQKKSVIIVNIHDSRLLNENMNQISYGKIPVVLLLRNLQRSILSVWNFEKTNNSFDKSVEDPWGTDKNTRREYANFNRYHSSQWNQFYSGHLSSVKNLLTIFYEDVVENPVHEVQKIVRFLGYQTDPERMACTKKYPTGPAKRNHSQVLINVSRGIQRPISRVVRNIVELLRKRGITPPEEYIKLADVK